MLLYLFIDPSFGYFTMQSKTILCKTCNLTIIFIVDPSRLWINKILSPSRNLHLWNLHLSHTTWQNQEGQGWILIDMRLNISFSKFWKEQCFYILFFLDYHEVKHTQEKEVALSGLPWCAPTVHQRWYGIQEGKTSCSLYHIQVPSPLGSIRGWKDNYFWLHNSLNQYHSEG